MSQRQPQILVLSPTRELAIQVAEAMQKYARHLPGFHILPIYGGQSMGQQLRQLDRGVHVVVGTPGRILDHLGRKSLDLSNLKAVVLDEADEMLRMGFIDDVDEILSHTPAGRQVALFSATMPGPIRRIAMRHLNEPVEIKIASKTSTVETITQRYWMVRGVHKLDALTRILEVTDFDAMIIFVRTKVITEELAEKLEARGFSSAALNGDLNQQQRERTVERLKQGSLDIIVATDVAARGLDVPRISHVFNYDIPNDTESYVHRIGRTGRAGRSGEAILFVAPREKRMLYAIEKATRQKIEPMQLPTRSEIVNHRTDQFKKQLDEVRHTEKLGFFRELIQEYQTENDLEIEDIAAALAFLVQKEQPLQPKIQDEPAAPPQGQRGERGERRERPERDGRGERRERRGREESQEPPVDLDMCRYRIEVGREHGVQPKNIVGAIANEISLDSEYIDNISIRDSFTILDLPDGMPKDVFEHLKTVRVCGRPLDITIDDGKSADSDGGRSEGRGRTGERGFKRGAGKPGGKPRAGAGAGKPRGAGSGAPKGRGKPAGGKPSGGKPAGAGFGNGKKAPRKKP
jgi:ATP-dependent RNA helicase DeaD